MTKIRLHGILKAEYGDCFYMDISRPRDVIKAIDANRDGFRKRLIDLQKEGMYYDILVDKQKVDKKSFLKNRKPMQLDIVPLITGHGPVGMFIASVVISIAIAVVMYALMDPGTIDGGSQAVGSGGESLIFQGGAANVSNQGDPLPIGYGRLMVGSNVIQSTVRSLPQTLKSIDSMTAVRYNADFSDDVLIRDSFIN